MIRRPTMRRAIVAALASASLLAGLPVGAQAEEIPRSICDFQWREGTWQLKQLIRCAARRWDSPGAPTKAQWASAGVARISHGPFPHAALMTKFEEMARDALA